MTDQIKILNHGRTPVTVTHLDGTTSEVIVRKLGLVELEQLARCKSLPSRATMYVAGMTPEQFDALEPESQMDIVELGGELNDPLLVRYFSQLQKQLKVQGVDLNRQINQKVEQALAASVAAEKAEHPAKEQPAA